MEDTTEFEDKQTRDGTTLAGDVRQRNAQIRRDVAIALWIIGFIALVRTIASKPPRSMTSGTVMIQCSGFHRS